MSGPGDDAPASVTAPEPSFPEPTFAVEDVDFVPFAASPTLRFRFSVSEHSEREVYTVALSIQINIDPARRTYDAPTRERLYELFGEPERWPATTRSFFWTRADTMTHGFTGQTTFDVAVPCTYDLEVAASKYMSSLPDGVVPLGLHFSGRILYRNEADRLQVVPVPWSGSAQFDLPAAVWQGMIAHHYPHAGWIRLHADTLDLLGSYKARRGLTSFDAAVVELLASAPTTQDQEGEVDG
jgi:uncharacterized protein DUF6084